LAVHFLGLYGPNGPLPLHLTEYIRSRQVNANDSTLVRFLDIFHHRILSLFYRAWANCEPVVSCDRPATDRFAVYVGSLLGYGLSSQSNRDAFPDPCKRYYAGLFAQQRRNAEGLNDLLADYFGLPVHLEEFIGEWLPLQPKDRWKLGGRFSTGCLGNGTILGANTWQRQTKFRLTFGPLLETDFNSFLPDGSRYAVLKSIVRNYVGDSLEWDLRLIPHQQDSQPFLLGKSSRLGWTSWLGKCPKGEIREDLIFSPIHDFFPIPSSRRGKARFSNNAVGSTAGR
jgi:type VI secretion system protein ImpH